MVPILSNFMLVNPIQKQVKEPKHIEMSIESSHEVIAHPNLDTGSLDKKSKFGIVWHVFDHLIMKPYFIYKFSNNNEKEYEEFVKMEKFL